MSKSTVLYDKFWYHPTSLVAKDGKVTLLGHRYQIRRGAVNIILSNKIDALEFADSQEMVEEIQKKRYRALPEEADGDTQYVPQRVKALKKKYEES
jgi:hypothetical protein